MTDEIVDKLVAELKKGNQNAFDIIFKYYYKILCREARGFFHNSHLVEEIVCDVFIKIWDNRKSLEITDTLRSYLLKAVHNNCINYYRAQKVQNKLKSEFDIKQKREFAIIDLGQNPLEYIITNELEKRLLEAIESLPPRYKEAFKLSRYQNQTYDEIAINMGISVNGVKMNIKKALEQLREKLADYLKIIIVLAVFNS